jgi:GNAT superfamily N-acetyltransferase
MIIRQAVLQDLAEINRVVESAVLSWRLPERVKRLSIPAYIYSAHDFTHMSVMVAEVQRRIVGVTAWEAADSRDVPTGMTGLLLHGVYVEADWQRKGIGSQLFRAAEKAAGKEGYRGLLVKAQAEAAGFFRNQRMQPLPVINPQRDYPYRFWKQLD